jgi:hypothetical protein
MTTVSAHSIAVRMMRGGVVLAVGLGVLGVGHVADAGVTQDSSGRMNMARLGQPEDVAFDVNGHLLVSEFSGNRVTRIVRLYARAVAGTGVAGYSGDGGPAVDARLNAPTGLFVERSGSLLLADHHNGCIRQVNPSGVIIAIVGRCGHQGFSGDGGPATAARLNDPIGITEDTAGNLYIADEQNARVRKVNSRGIITTIAGGGRRNVATVPDGILATKLKLSHPSYVVVDARGHVYFSDFLANVVTEIDRSGRIRHVAGTGKAGFSGDGGQATKAKLNFPTGLTLGRRHNLYISDAFNNRIRKVNRRGVITTVAGTGRPGDSGDGGPAVKARLNATAGLALDARGRLVIADQGNNLIRRVNNTGTITTIAGTTARTRARSQGARAQPHPIPVLTSAANEITPAATGAVLTWSKSSTAHPNRYSEFARTASGTVRVNSLGTQASGGGVSGTTLIYQRFNPRAGASDLRLSDVHTGFDMPPPAGWNTSAWESGPTISGKWVLFFRDGNAKSVILGNLSTGNETVLARLTSKFAGVGPGQVNGNYAVSIECPQVQGLQRPCFAYRYDIGTGTKTRLPDAVSGDDQLAASVSATGTAYVVERRKRCGHGVLLIRQPLDGPAAIVHTFSPGVDVGSTYVDDTSGTPTVYYSKGVCVGGDVPNADIYKIVD